MLKITHLCTFIVLNMHILFNISTYFIPGYDMYKGAFSHLDTDAKKADKDTISRESGEESNSAPNKQRLKIRGGKRDVPQYEEDDVGQF